MLAFFASALLYACITFHWPVALCVALLLCAFCVRISRNFSRIYRKFELRGSHMIDGRMIDDDGDDGGPGPGGGVGAAAGPRQEAAWVISQTQRPTR